MVTRWTKRQLFTTLYTTTTSILIICSLLLLWPKASNATAAAASGSATYTITTDAITSSRQRRQHRYHRHHHGDTSRRHPASWLVHNKNKKDSSLLEQQQRQQQHARSYIGLQQQASTTTSRTNQPLSPPIKQPRPKAWHKKHRKEAKAHAAAPFHHYHHAFPKPKSKEYRPHVDVQQQQQQATSSATVTATSTSTIIPEQITANKQSRKLKATDTTTTTPDIFDTPLPPPSSALQQHSNNHHTAQNDIEEKENRRQEPVEAKEVHTRQKEVATLRGEHVQQQQNEESPQTQQKQKQNENKTQRYRRVVIEGSTQALFFCPSCKEALQAEQDFIWQAIQDQYNSNNSKNDAGSKPSQFVVTMVRAKKDLINALFVKIPILSKTNTPVSIPTRNRVRNLQQQQYIQVKGINSNGIMLDLENNDHASDNDEKVDDDTQMVDQWLQSLPGVVRVSPSQDYQAMNDMNSGDTTLNNIKQQEGDEGEQGQFQDDIMSQAYDSSAQYPTMYQVADYLGSRTVSESSLNCLTGQGIRVAVLDTGVDYTHSVFGGRGTSQAYQQAYGAARNASENTERQTYFPTSQVVAGIDYVGDGEEMITISDLHPDADPIDSPTGHGTKVASAIVATAPNVELIAIKVCSNIGSCPDFSMVDGLEYAIRQGAKIANLSLGRWYTSSYYSITAKAIEDAFQLGLTTIVAAGNENNVPWVIGGISAVPNAITIGSTLAKVSTSRYARSNVGTGVMASYSSRGPGSNNMIKPDLSAPGGAILLARSGSGKGGVVAQGTSFAAPFVAGALALLMEKCGPTICSPFSLKAILMNTAKRTTKYHDDENDESLAPISWVGSGEMDIEKAVQADFYAYSLEDVQPSLSLGLTNVVEDVVMTKTIRIINMEGSPAHDLDVSYQFRDPNDERSGAMTIHIAETTVSLASSSDCNSTIINQVDVSIEFRIHASNVPSNYMTASGIRGNSPEALDRNEFDGWIVIRSNNNNNKDISLPFLALLRKASHVTVGNPILPEIKTSPQFIPVNMVNTGAGVAQIDSYELLHISEDDAETEFGSGLPSADFRFVGYQTRKVDEPNCEYILEFAFTLWEAERRPVNTQHEVRIDVDGDFKADFILANRAQQYHQTLYSECRIQDTITGEWKCAGFAPDHSTNTANTIIRACSDDFGIKAPATLNVGFSSVAFPAVTITADASPAVRITVPATSLAAPSYDIAPGDTLSHIMVTGATNVRASLGLLLITNAFRSVSSTGAATRETEAIALTFDGVKLPREITPDVLMFPVATKLNGPDCRWRDASSRRSEGGTCPSTLITSRHERLLQPMSEDSNITAESVDVFHRNMPDILDGHRRRVQSNSEACPQHFIPRPLLASSMPSQSPSMTPVPTILQTMTPSTRQPTQIPTMWQPPPPQPEAIQLDLIPAVAPVYRIPASTSPVLIVDNLSPSIPRNNDVDGEQDNATKTPQTPIMPEGLVTGDEETSAAAAVSAHTSISLLMTIILAGWWIILT